MKHKLIVLVLAFCSYSIVYSQQIFRYLYSFDNGVPLYGLADSAGNTLTAGVYNNVHAELNGAIKVTAGMRSNTDYANARYGFLYPDGQQLCPLIYSMASDFSDGMALVGKPTGAASMLGALNNYGYIDIKGRNVISCTYKYAENFSEGLAAVAREDKKWMYIDKTGKVVIPGPFDKAMPFSEGLAAVQVPYTKNGVISFKVGYIDKTGAMVVQPEYIYGRPFSKGTAIVQATITQPAYKSYSVLIDRKGKQLTPGGYIDISKNSDGNIVVKRNGSPGINKETDEWGLLDAAYKLRPEVYKSVPYYDKQLNFYQDPVSKLWGYKDLLGNIKIQPAYKNSWAFNEGLAPVIPADNNLYGFINGKNQMVIAPQFTNTGAFRNGTVIVTKKSPEGKNLQGVIDRTGKVVYPLGEYAIVSYKAGRVHLVQNYIEYFDYGNGKTSLAKDLETLKDTRYAIACIAKNNAQAAYETLNKLEAKNYSYANYWLGFLLLKAPAPMNNVSRGAALIRKAATANIPEALHAMGYLYHTGVDGTRDYQQALSWYQKAGAKGSADSYRQAGHIYEQGLLGTKDIPAAIKEYTKAAELFSAAAMYYLGLIYFEGNGVTADKIKGRSWLQQAADLGLKEAKDYLLKTAKM